ncbi:hypothetical protein HQ489_06090 [Candidatus Woesearchaeota archaeon]|nr:hypothetical protein [Candidatus Woesearchaeota archaeon]
MENISIKKSTMWKGAGLVLIAVIGFFLFQGGDNNVTGNVVGSVNGITEITTTIQGFQYFPAEFTVNKGDTVKLTIINKDNVLHGLHLPQFGLGGGTPAGATKMYEFTAVEGPTNGMAIPTCSQEHGETLTIIVK